MINLGEFSKLRELLKDFLPVVSRVDSNVDKIYKYIKGEMRETPWIELNHNIN